MRDGDSAKVPSGWQMAGWLLLGFLIWLYCFKGFVTGRLALQSDAVGYYQHVKFFIDNMVHGVYPMWDPGVNGGVPNEFFLRRMGSFNPFYLFPVLLRLVGVPHLQAYTIFLSIYYLVASLGFYYLCRVLLRNPVSAYAGYLLFLFSSLGTRQFDSYIVLVVVPLIWFFAFFLQYCRQPSRLSLLGFTYCLMNLATTYIPLYFFVIFVSFAVFVTLFFPQRTLSGLRRGLKYAWQNKVLAFICIVGLAASMIPALMIFQSAKQGEFVMPRRASTATSEHALAVGKQTVTEWAMLEELVYASAYVDMRRFKFAVIYFPGLLYVMYFMGGWVRIRKLFLFLCVWGGFLFLLSVPALSPVYDTLHQNIFLFKYFRNLHWFFWLAMLPIFIFAAVYLWDELLHTVQSRLGKGWWIGWTALVHISFAIVVVHIGNTIWSTYAMLILSAILFGGLVYPALRSRPAWLCALLLVSIGGQSLEVYHYLNKNSHERKGYYKGDIAYDPHSYQGTEIMGVPTKDKKPSLYYALRNYHELYSAVTPDALFGYKQDKFVLFDRWQNVNAEVFNYAQLERVFRTQENQAYTMNASSPSGTKGGGQYRPIKEEGAMLALNKASVNTIRLSANVAHPTLLVFNQNWHRLWRAKINGQAVNVVPTNGAFMGLVLPAGESQIAFSYGPWGYRILHGLILLLFYAMAIAIGWQVATDRRQQRSLRGQ